MIRKTTRFVIKKSYVKGYSPYIPSRCHCFLHPCNQIFPLNLSIVAQNFVFWSSSLTRNCGSPGSIATPPVLAIALPITPLCMCFPEN